MTFVGHRNGQPLHVASLCGLCFTVLLVAHPALAGIEIGKPLAWFTTPAARFVDGKKSDSTFNNIHEPKVTVYTFAGTKCPATNTCVDRLKPNAAGSAAQKFATHEAILVLSRC